MEYRRNRCRRSADYLARSHRHPHRGDGEHQGNGIPRVFDWIGVGFLLPRVDQFGQAVGGTAWHYRIDLVAH